MFRKVLIANRGEIAVRVVRTCRRLGIPTVAVWSDADADALHVRAADESVRLGPAPAADSYLAIDRILDAALRTGAEAVHPGYGFLAESPDFAAACEEKDLVFIGPRADTIRLMADKAAAKRHLEAAGVPVVPGIHDEHLDDGALAHAATGIGYPVLLKAVAGGGGKGMRRVDRPADLDEAIAGARREGEASFGDPRLLVEKLVERPRHIEFQVFGDGHGGALHLFERECSIQRRHQKVVEETPSPALDEALRARMADAAVRATASVDYRGAGTVEMLLSDTTRDFYFLEMNTRLQVEHPVTELVTGEDLVEWQLRIAAGEGLPRTQGAVASSGHAIEVRLYAEDPARGHLPQTGELLAFQLPEGPGIRVDAGVETGSRVSPHYDPMLAKLVVHGRDRADAIGRMTDLLRDAVVLGVVTNLDHLHDIVDHPAFASGDLTTSFLDEHLPDWGPGQVPAATSVAATAGLLQVARTARSAPPDPWSSLGPWRLGGMGGWRVRLEDASGTEHAVAVTGRRDALHVTADDVRHDVVIVGVRHDGALRLDVDGDEVDAHVAVQPRGGDEDADTIWVHLPGVTTRLRAVAPTRHADPGLAAAGEAFASPMPGSVVVVNVAEGDHVPAGTTLLVIEAMKMEHPIKAPVAGTITGLRVAVGDAVESDQPLVALEPDPDAGSP